MSEITPAYLAKFVHPVPEGATIPAGTEYAWQSGSGIYQTIFTQDITQLPGDRPRWTADPIPATRPTLADRARKVAHAAERDCDEGVYDLAAIVAELAERIEADR